MIHVLKQIDKEKLKMYMGLKKIELAKMLIDSNKRLERLTPTIYFPQTSTAGSYDYTLTSTASFATDEAKSKTIGKTGLEKKRRSARKGNSKKR